MKTLMRRALPLLLLLAAVIPAAAQTQQQLYTDTATIASGQSLSAAVDLRFRQLIGVIMPSTWTDANVTFQVSVGGTNFFDLYSFDGTEFTITVAGTPRYFAIDPFEFLMVRYVKVRSGTGGSPVTQAGARSITLVTRAVYFGRY